MPKYLFVSLLFCLSAIGRAETNKPNIVVILVDDAGYADFGFQGDNGMKTPNIDAIADSGVRFTKGYVSAPVCAPSRAGLLTGRYQQRFSFERNLTGKEDLKRGLAQGEKTLGDHFKGAGYSSAAIGKWHVGFKEQYHPNKRGFDYFYGIMGGQRAYFNQEVYSAKDKERLLQRNGETIAEPLQGYVTDILTDEALGFIDRNKEQPFLLYLSYTAVHTPMEAKKNHLAQVPAHITDQTRRQLFAMTASLDENIGRVTGKLDDLGLSDNTIVVFLNDNGGPKSNGSNNAPLRGNKGSTFEGGIRVPFVMKWPQRIKAGSQYDKMVISLDLLPTLLAAAGANALPNSAAMDGVNLLPYLNGEYKSSPHSSLYFKFYSGKAHIKGEWKWMMAKVKQADGSKQLQTFLFNLNQDPTEQTNLIGTNVEKAAELSEQWQRWHNEMPEVWTIL